MTEKKPCSDIEMNLVSELREGNQDACLLIERWSMQIACSKFHGIPPEDRRDIVQDVVEKVIESTNKPEFEISVCFRAYVTQITITKCIDWLRKQRPTVSEFDDFLVDKDNPYKNTLDNENKNILHWAIMSLTKSCKNLIRRHFLDELSYSEMAKTDGTAVSTVRVKVHRCISKLKIFFKLRGLKL